MKRMLPFRNRNIAENWGHLFNCFILRAPDKSYNQDEVKQTQAGRTIFQQ